jgi:putative transposase
LGLFNGVTLDFSRPGKTGNAYAESFNAAVPLECLGRHWFLDLDDAAREKIEEWQTEYNEVRPHSAIGDRTPMSLIHRSQQHAAPEILTRTGLIFGMRPAKPQGELRTG